VRKGLCPPGNLLTLLGGVLPWSITSDLNLLIQGLATFYW